MREVKQELETLADEIRGLKELMEATKRASEMPSVLSYERAAWELSVSVDTLKRMLARGQILATDRGVGFDPGISRSEVLRIATNQRTSIAPRRIGRAKAPKGGSVSERVRTARLAAKAKAKDD